MTVSAVRTTLLDLVLPLSKTVDMMSPAVAGHHLDVAYLSLRIAEQVGMPEDETREVVLAAMLHDVGAFSLDERLDLLEFEIHNPDRHCTSGHLLLKDFPPFAKAAEIIWHHHTKWRNGRSLATTPEDIRKASQILHLADRIAVLVPRSVQALSKVSSICARIEEQRGDWFMPELVDAVKAFAAHDHVWLDIASRSVEGPIRTCLSGAELESDLDDLLAFGALVCRLIDFRSPYTATHTSGLAATAETLAERVGFSEEDRKLLRLAAYLHDIGKLAVPLEILEKPERLTETEWHTMRSHVYYTFQALTSAPAFNALVSWSALHQERLDGSGYPFGYTGKDLSPGARVLAVADVFTGITEDRPYRDGMNEAEARGVLQRMAAENELDSDVVEVLLADYATFDRARADAQAKAREDFEAFRRAQG